MGQPPIEVKYSVAGGSWPSAVRTREIAGPRSRTGRSRSSAGRFQSMRMSPSVCSRKKPALGENDQLAHQ
ncbi:hypothetical protein KBY56_17765 [Streptomyces sp. C3-3]|nr:hypothetical protein [Streptomyces sp. C3-3]